MNWRMWHRLLSPWLFVLLAVSALTGMGYRLGRQWLGLDKDSTGWLMEVHTGEWLGDAASPLYVLFAGAGLLFLLATGVVMLRQRASKVRLRLWHRVLGAVLLLPLAVTALTGVAFKVAQAWLGVGEEDAGWLMTLHEGAWLGRDLRAYYVLLTGGGLLLLGALGLRILVRRARGHS